MNAFTRTVTPDWATSRINQCKRSLNEISDRPRLGLSPVKSNMVNQNGRRQSRKAFGIRLALKTCSFYLYTGTYAYQHKLMRHNDWNCLKLTGKAFFSNQTAIILVSRKAEIRNLKYCIFKGNDATPLKTCVKI